MAAPKPAGFSEVNASWDAPPANTQLQSVLAYAEQQGLMGPKDRQMSGRFPTALVEAAQAASGITEPTDLLTYALAKIAFEDNYGEKLLRLEGTVPRGTFEEYGF
jgi:hypothetical protein